MHENLSLAFFWEMSFVCTNLKDSRRDPIGSVSLTLLLFENAVTRLVKAKNKAANLLSSQLKYNENAFNL